MIRALRSSDREVLFALLEAFFEALRESAGDTFSDQAARIYTEIYSQGGDAFALAREVDGMIRSVLLGRIVERPARRPARVLLLDAAYTEPEYRGRGIMEALLDGARDWCRERSVAAMELSTPLDGPAQNYWARHGFDGRFVSMSYDFERDA